MKQTYDLIIVGGGHAGVEAANISSKIGCKSAVVTMDKNSIGRMSCNPAIGGIAKGQIVREIDVLGGLMGGAADHSGLQFKTLLISQRAGLFGPPGHKQTSAPMKNIFQIRFQNIKTLRL